MPGAFGSLFSELSAGGEGAIRDPQMPAAFRHTEVPLHCSHWLVPTEISPRSPPGHLICRRTAPQPNSLNQQVATSADIPPKSSLPFFVFFGPCPHLLQTVPISELSARPRPKDALVGPAKGGLGPLSPVLAGEPQEAKSKQYSPAKDHGSSFKYLRVAEGDPKPF